MARFSLLFLWLWSITVLHAAVTIEEIASKPSSRARDFLIWEFLRQKGVSQASAKAAFALVKNKSNYKLKKAYAKIVDDEIRKELLCSKRKDLLNIMDEKCLQAAFSIHKTIRYSRFQRDQLLIEGLTSQQKTLLKLQNEPYSFNRYIYYDPKMVINYIMSVSKKTVERKLDQKLDTKSLVFLQSAPNFGSFVQLVVTDYNLKKLQHSLINADGKKLDAATNFFLALNALRHHNKRRAVLFLQLARQKAHYPIPRDKADFWLYMTTKDRSYLETLLLSMSINIYTLYAHEKLSVDTENYFTKLITTKQKSKYDLQNPFDWFAILENIRKTNKEKLFDLVKRYQNFDLLPVQRFVLERAYDFKMHGYIMPYEREMKQLGIEDKALMYAIMRQESNYIPSGLSRSFALGLMQLMPFLVDHIAKRKGDKIESYSEMFHPLKNLEYAWTHLRWLKKVLNDNPLFIAYAYNGGYGFFKRYKSSGRFGKGKYEPFLSMELMHNAESREYAKRVLSNYAMYKKIYKEPFSLVSFFEKLK